MVIQMHHLPPAALSPPSGKGQQVAFGGKPRKTSPHAHDPPALSFQQPSRAIKHEIAHQCGESTRIETR